MGQIISLEGARARQFDGDGLNRERRAIRALGPLEDLCHAAAVESGLTIAAVKELARELLAGDLDARDGER